LLFSDSIPRDIEKGGVTRHTSEKTILNPKNANFQKPIFEKIVKFEN